MKKVKKQQNRATREGALGENGPPSRQSHTVAWIVFAALVCFCVAGLFLVNDYGTIVDSRKNYSEGEMNLDYVLGRPLNEYVLHWQMHGAFVFMLADAAKRLLSDHLHLYDAVAGRHVILPLLTATFLAILFLFVRRHWGALQGAIAAGLLLTFPSFWGDTFNNLKDVPLLIFFSLAIMAFAEFRLTGRKRYLYGACILWGFSLAIKTYALLAPVVVLAWVLLTRKGDDWPAPLRIRAILPHAAAGLVLSLLIFLAFFAPAFWGVEDKLSYLVFWRERVKSISWGTTAGFNLIPFTQVLSRTPALVLIFALTGIVVAVRDRKRTPLYPLVLLWTFIPLIGPCLPRTLSYHNGMRHFLVFLTPFCMLAMIGLDRAARFLAASLRRKEQTVTAALGLLTLCISFAGIVTTHPYETAFFNGFAGGLKGAQAKNIPDAYDYWLNSYKEAGRWISEHGAADAHVMAVPEFNVYLISQTVSRPDITLVRVPDDPVRADSIPVPANTYVVVVPFPHIMPYRLFLEQSTEFRQVYRITRQGGEVCAIYYKPPSPG